MKETTKNQSVVKHHYVRTIFASLFGIIALWLILASVVVVWLNHTLTDTNTYVTTVSPLVTKPAVQNFFAEKITEQINNQGSVQDVATVLLPASQAVGGNPDQLKAAIQSVVSTTVQQVLSSDQFQKLWQDTNRTAHQQLLAQVRANSSELSVDLSPALTGLLAQLKTTRLAPVVEKIDIKTDSVRLNLKGNNIQTVNRTYRQFQQATIALVVVTIIFATLSVLISVHHAKTIRRILAGTGVGLLVLGVFLQIGSLVKFSGPDKSTQELAVTLAATLLHTLRLTALIAGVVCIVAAVGSALYTRSRSAKVVSK